MPAQITNYKCPACTGPLHFESSSGKMECEYCGSVFEVAEIENMYAGANQQASTAAAQAEEHAKEEAAQIQQMAEEGWDMSGTTDWGADGNGMVSYNCPSCGAELIFDQNTIATSCPYCDNPTFVPGKMDGTLKPDVIIPFKLDKEAAKAALRKHTQGKKLLPKAFTNENHLDEIKGVYVPYWLYDATADGDFRFDATRTRSWSDSDYNYAETEHYEITRSGTLRFEHIPADGSSKMDDDLMDSIEPYDYSEAVPFQSAYLTGYMADKYDVTAQDNLERANNRVKNSTSQVFRDTVNGYDTVSEKFKTVRVRNGKAKYALYPVWLMNTTWNDKKYVFAMNGQTGKIVGDMPMDKRAYWKWRAIYTLAIGAVIFAITNIFGLL